MGWPGWHAGNVNGTALEFLGAMLVFLNLLIDESQKSEASPPSGVLSSIGQQIQIYRECYP